MGYGLAVSSPNLYHALTPMGLEVGLGEVMRDRGGHEEWGPLYGIGGLTRTDTVMLVFRLSQALPAPIPHVLISRKGHMSTGRTWLPGTQRESSPAPSSAATWRATWTPASGAVGESISLG